MRTRIEKTAHRCLHLDVLGLCDCSLLACASSHPADCRGRWSVRCPRQAGGFVPLSLVKVAPRCSGNHTLCNHPESYLTLYPHSHSLALHISSFPHAGPQLYNLLTYHTLPLPQWSSSSRPRECSARSLRPRRLRLPPPTPPSRPASRMLSVSPLRWWWW